MSRGVFSRFSLLLAAGLLVIGVSSCAQQEEDASVSSIDSTLAMGDVPEGDLTPGEEFDPPADEPPPPPRKTPPPIPRNPDARPMRRPEGTATATRVPGDGAVGSSLERADRSIATAAAVRPIASAPRNT